MSRQIIAPSFKPSTLQERTDGYWIETFHFSKNDKAPGLIASGLNSGNVQFLDNPVNAAERYNNGDSDSSWKVYDIGRFDTPVAIIGADITGNGLLDLIVCHDFGPTMLDCNMNGGWISWLENPGRDALRGKSWTRRVIGRWPAMHRMKAGHFTQRSIIEIIAAPVLRGKHDKATPVPILRFQAPERVQDALEWHRDVVDDKHFTVIHEITSKKLHESDGLDSLLIASREGVSWLYFENGRWTHKSIGLGEPRSSGQSLTSETPGTGDNWGSGNVDVGRMGADPFAYIATMDPFHGPSVSVYTKIHHGHDKTSWKRHVLDIYGTPNQMQKHGDGPGHFVVCGDFDGDGDDEFLVSQMGPLDRDDKGEAIPALPGPNPNKGIMYYKAIDLPNGIFAKWKIDPNSSARVALGDFNGNGKLDVASIGYNVRKYYEEPKPTVTLLTNQIAQPVANHYDSPIATSSWDGEGIVYFADPSRVKMLASVALIEVANFAITAEIHPPGSKFIVGRGEGVKVLYGSLEDTYGKRRPLGDKPFPDVGSTSSEDGFFRTDKIEGAIVLRMKPVLQEDSQSAHPGWSHALEVPVRTTFDLSKSGLEMSSFKFTKVDKLWWGGDFKNIEFYNLSGFHFRFLGSKMHIAHMQFWVAGTNVSAVAHNHSNDYFNEIHIGLSLGTKTGGMSQIKPEYEHLSQEQAEKLFPGGYTHRTIKPLEEHGGMWKLDRDGKPLRGRNNVVVYPWHKWQAGEGSNVDVWLALEFNPDLHS
ncbi:hypothetical protein F4804DRAFT_326094 [Jackrogersella minutella]|nr:hypothetical protein F4804DRAFT_326094 [Jackrogersella minutella]